MNSTEYINACVTEADVGPSSVSLPPAEVLEIDISSFVFPDQASEAQRDSVVTQFLSASTSLGFMNIVGHGVHQSTIDNALAALTTFFQSTREQKDGCVAQSANGTQRGYNPFRSENVGAVLGRQSPADLRECYSFGPPDHLEGAAFGVNTYPKFVDSFRQCIDAYYAEMERLEKLLLEIFTRALAKATGLCINPRYLEEQIEPNRGLLKAAWYPPCQPSSDESRCGGHTDWGPLTILLTASPGLEVCIRPKEGDKYQWRSVPVVPGAFTVNVADQLARWSNDRFVSCIHRVNANLNCNLSRISIPYFSTQILPLGDMCGPQVGCICCQGEEAKYAPLSIRDYLREKFASLQARGASGGA